MKAVKTLLTVLLCMAMVALSGGILGTLLLFGSWMVFRFSQSKKA